MYYGVLQTGHDVNIVGAVDTSAADELGIFTDGVYSLFAELVGSGFAAGDQVEVELVFEYTVTTPLAAPKKLTAIVRADGTLDAGLVFPSQFLPKWTRLSLRVTPHYAGATPTQLAVQWGIAFVTGQPATSDAVPAVQNLTVDTSTNDGNAGINWTDIPGGVINNGYMIIVYDDNNDIVVKQGMSPASSGFVATGLADGGNYEAMVVGSLFNGGTLVYGVAATTGFTGAVAPDPVTGVVVTSDAASITVTSWVAPAAGTPVASYNVTLLDAAGTTVVQGPTSVDAAGPLTASFTGLTASTAYTVRVTAVSAGGAESTPVDTAKSTTAGAWSPSDARADAPSLDTLTGSVTYDCSAYSPNSTDTVGDGRPWDALRLSDGGTGPMAPRSAWVKYVCTVSGTATFDTIGSGYDTFLCVFDDSGLEVASDDDSGNTHGGSSGESWLSVAVTAGTTYWIRPSPYASSADGGGTSVQQAATHFNWNVPG